MWVGYSSLLIFFLYFIYIFLFLGKGKGNVDRITKKDAVAEEEEEGCRRRKKGSIKKIKYKKI